MKREPQFLGETRRPALVGKITREEAMAARRKAFWDPILNTFFGKDKAATFGENREDKQRALGDDFLRVLAEKIEKFSKGSCDRPDKYVSQVWRLSVAMYVAAFDMSYEYSSEEDETSDTDVLEEESSFRIEVLNEVGRYILEGAATAKKIDSKSYDNWIEALILNSRIISDDFEPTEIEQAAMAMVQSLVAAQTRLWADMDAYVRLDAKKMLEERMRKCQSNGKKGKI